jgi:hypothetical protein
MRERILVGIVAGLGLGSLALSFVILRLNPVQAQSEGNVKTWTASDPPRAVRALLSAHQAMPGTHVDLDGSIGSLPAQKRLAKFNVSGGNSETVIKKTKPQTEVIGAGLKKMKTIDAPKQPVGFVAFTAPQLKNFKKRVEGAKAAGRGTAVESLAGGSKTGPAVYKYKIQVKGREVQDFRIKKIKQGR